MTGNFSRPIISTMKMMIDTEQAIALIRKSNRIAALSGAGISTEAGIPDFRGPQGMWNDPALLRQLSVSGFQRNPEGFYRESMKLLIGTYSSSLSLAACAKRYSGISTFSRNVLRISAGLEPSVAS